MIFKIFSKNSCFWVKNTGQESFRPKLKLKVELLLTASCHSGLDWQGSVVHFWADGTTAVQFNPQPEGGYSCSSHFQHPQSSNCHCWDQESSQIAMVTYPLMLRGSATAKHWPTDTWYSQLFFPSVHCWDPPEPWHFMRRGGSEERISDMSKHSSPARINSRSSS